MEQLDRVLDQELTKQQDDQLNKQLDQHLDEQLDEKPDQELDKEPERFSNSDTHSTQSSAEELAVGQTSSVSIQIPAGREREEDVQPENQSTSITPQ